jgi:hypothetical protein
VDFIVLWEKLKSNIIGYNIENREDQSWLFS